jgi:hypothetical protein
MSESSARRDLQAYREAAHDVERLLGGEPALLERQIERISGWSPVQHAAHLTLANELVLKNVLSLVKGSGMLVVTEAAQIPRALQVLASGTLPRGEAKSPRMVVPPLDSRRAGRARVGARSSRRTWMHSARYLISSAYRAASFLTSYSARSTSRSGFALVSCTRDTIS